MFFAGGYPLESLEQAVEESDFAVAIAQCDDIVKSRGKSRPALRDNVIFELGLFMGRLGRSRTILVQPKVRDLVLPSDLHGLTTARYELGSPDELAERLGSVCAEIRKIVRKYGIRPRTTI